VDVKDLIPASAKDLPLAHFHIDCGFCSDADKKETVLPTSIAKRKIGMTKSGFQQ
jgi:hypothetical protein